MTGRKKALKKMIRRQDDKITQLRLRLESALKSESRLARQIADHDGAAMEMSMAMDSILAAVAMSYGAKRPNGDLVLTLGQIDTVALIKAWAVRAERIPDGYRITVSKRKDPP